jgi:hypothetical protein
MMSLMPAIPESTRTSLAQRLHAHARANWPQLATVHVRYRGQFAYVDGELTDGEFNGTTEEVFDLVCDLHVTNAAT